MARSLASPVDRMSVRTPQALRPAAVGTVDTLPRLPPVDHRPASTLDHGQSAAAVGPPLRPDRGLRRADSRRHGPSRDFYNERYAEEVPSGGQPPSIVLRWS